MKKRVDNLSIQQNLGAQISQKISDLKMLTKFRLSMMVVFSAGAGFILGSGVEVIWTEFMLLCLGGFLVTGASNALNQVIEKDFDKLMPRTEDRPLATGRMSVSEGVLIAGVLSVSGLLILATFNPIVTLLGALSLLSYAFVYTPLKRVSPIAVIVGAFPGAFPPMIGWVAASGYLGIEALILFGIQFMWQFPHFWAIAWVSFEDYKKGGFNLLPSRKRDKASALQCVIYSLILIPTSLLLYFMGITGLVAAIIIGITGLVYLLASIQLYIKCDRKSALQLMFTSFFYLPIVLIAICADKL